MSLESREAVNWDNLDIGDSELDHSQNFFGTHHHHHDFLKDLATMEMINKQFASTDLRDIYPDSNQNVVHIKVEDKYEEPPNQNLHSSINSTEQAHHYSDTTNIKKSPVSVNPDQNNLENKENSMPIAINKLEHNNLNDVELDNKEYITQIENYDQENESELENKEYLTQIENVDQDNLSHLNSPSSISQQSVETSETVAANSSPKEKRPLNLVSQWSSQKQLVNRQLGAVQKSAPPPHAYQFKDIYQRKKQNALRERQEEERKMREFHSRPVPNFNVIHQQIERRRCIHPLTLPVTPQVLKNSREADEKRRKRIEEWKQQKQHQPPKFESHSPRPFNLHTEKRLKERREFDEAIQRSVERKRKKEEEERKRREEEEVKIFRKLATFKARPNPFK